jgi:vancomycin resistance protein YoaR
MISSAVAGPDALLVTREKILENGKVVVYSGVKRVPVGGVGLLEQIIQGLKRPAQPARWVKDKTKGWIAIERPGYYFDLAAAKRAYLDALDAGKSEFRLPVTYIGQFPTADDFYNLGIRELLSEGQTNFYGSIPSRIHNIHLTTSRFEGVIIEPGEIFSFLKTVGEISLRTGFQEAFVIIGDKTETGVGGGVCQVSSTLFRAAYFAGLPIVERRHHSYQVGYYRPTGLDATVYSPTQDFRFKNDTPGHLLILTEIRGYNLIFRLFGTRDRSVEWRGPFISNRVAAPPPRYIVDPSLRPGRRRQIDFAQGARVAVQRTIRFDDGRTVNDTLVSNYRPWGAIYLVGPTPPPPPPKPEEVVPTPLPPTPAPTAQPQDPAIPVYNPLPPQSPASP